MKKRILALVISVVMLLGSCAVMGVSAAGIRTKDGYYSACKYISELFGRFGIRIACGQKENKQTDTAVNNIKTAGSQTKQDLPDSSTSSDASRSLSSQYELEVIRLVNAERAKYGLSALTLNSSLTDLCMKKSEDMMKNRYFAHQSPTYGSAFDMMKKAGISYRAAGENIAMGYSSPAAVVKAWMNSEGHRANILNSKFTQIGVGYIENGNYWTQMFIG